MSVCGANAPLYYTKNYTTMERFAELGRKDFLALQDVMEDFVKAVERRGELDDDGSVIILVGDEDGGHDRLWIGDRELKAMKRFIGMVWQ